MKHIGEKPFMGTIAARVQPNVAPFLAWISDRLTDEQRKKLMIEARLWLGGLPETTHSLAVMRMAVAVEFALRHWEQSEP